MNAPTENEDDDDRRQIAHDDDDDDGSDEPTEPTEPTMRAKGSPRPGKRKADARRVVVCFTRAFLTASRVRFPRLTDPDDERVPKGPDAFLRWAYGSAFDEGRYWHAMDDPRRFFEHLLIDHAATRPVSKRGPARTLATVEDVFFKQTSKRRARWIFDPTTERRLGFGSEDLVRVAVAMRGREFMREWNESVVF